MGGVGLREIKLVIYRGKLIDDMEKERKHVIDTYENKYHIKQLHEL